MCPFTRRSADAVSSLGESGLIAAIKQWLGNASPPPPAGIGDDCAVVEGSLQKQVITVDPVIYGRHFDDRVSPRDVGAKLLKRNLSDIAAMGADPTVAVIALMLDPSVKREWLRQFYLGLAATARKFGVSIVGGDVAQAPGVLIASLTQLGQAATTRVLTRGGASIGDAIYVTGRLGGSILGNHARFTPRLAEGKWLAARSEVSAMMDLSDGLAKDIHALTPAGAWPHVLADAVPISAAAKRLSAQTKKPALEHALTDGEDYELIFTISPKKKPNTFETAWRKTLKTPLTRIGTFINKPSTNAAAVHWERYRGYEHLR